MFSDTLPPMIRTPFGQRLFLARTFAKLGQKELCAAVGMSQSNYSKLEREGVGSTYTTKIARVCKVSADWLADGSGTMLGGLISPQNSSTLVTNTDVSDTMPTRYPVSGDRFRAIWVVGRGAGGSMSERIWNDGQHPVGCTEEYAEVASSDPLAFLVEVVGTSMVPRYNPGEYALVEPGTDPNIDDDVLVRLTNGETMLKKLLSRSGGYRLGSYNSGDVLHYPADEISWIYYVAHPVPRRKIKTRM